METVYFGWVDEAVEVQEGVELPQFSLVGTILNDCSTNYTTGQIAKCACVFPCISQAYCLCFVLCNVPCWSDFMIKMIMTVTQLHRNCV